MKKKDHKIFIEFSKGLRQYINAITYPLKSCIISNCCGFFDVLLNLNQLDGYF